MNNQLNKKNSNFHVLSINNIVSIKIHLSNLVPLHFTNCLFKYFHIQNYKLTVTSTNEYPSILRRQNIPNEYPNMLGS